MPFYYYPSYLLGGLLIYLGPAVLLLYLAVWRRMKLSHPRCAKCQYDLRTCWNQAHCPECGSDLQQRGCVLFTEKDMSIRKTPLILMVIWLAAPVVLSIFVFAHSQTSGVAALPRYYTPQLIEKLADPNEITSPWCWQELEKRANRGELSPQQYDRIVVLLTAYLKATDPNRSNPLAWCGDILSSWIIRDRISADVLGEMLEAYYDYPVDVQFVTVDRQFQRTDLYMSYEQMIGIAHGKIMPNCFLTKAILDGPDPQSLAFGYMDTNTDKQRNPDEPLAMRYPQNQIYIKRMLPEGEHILVLSFTTRYDKPLTDDIKQNAANRTIVTCQRDIRFKITIDKRGNGKAVQVDEQNNPITQAGTAKPRPTRTKAGPAGVFE